MADEIVCLTPKPLDSNKNFFEGMFSALHYKRLFSMTLIGYQQFIVDCRAFQRFILLKVSYQFYIEVIVILCSPVCQ